jgi:SAM-dependent methyltransferase
VPPHFTAGNAGGLIQQVARGASLPVAATGTQDKSPRRLVLRDIATSRFGRMTEVPSYWRSAVEDAAMQDAHGFVWKAMLKTVDADLAGKLVLDAGCNRGGFLRLLCDRCGIAEGRGFDPASAAIDDARRLAGSRPLRFEVADTVPAGWGSFDLAFGHEVLYLLHDLSAHARAIFEALAPGGSYYPVIGVHAGSPLMAEWHRANSDELQLPKLYSIAEVVGAFAAAGFEVAAARLEIGFVPVASAAPTVAGSGHSSGDHAAPSELLRWLEYYNDHKLLLRCTRPARNSDTLDAVVAMSSPALGGL